MAHINKRTIFLKDKGGNVAATAAITEISGNITIKINCGSFYGGKNKMFFAAEGDVFPFMLYEITSAKSEKSAKGAAGENISAIIFIYDKKSAEITAYGCIGDNISQQTLLNKALQSMAGDKIIAPVSSGNFEIIQEQDRTAAESESAVSVGENPPQIYENTTPQTFDNAEKTEQTQQKKDQVVIQTVTNMLQDVEAATEESQQALTEQSNEEENLQQFYQDTYNILAEDKYIAEDTTLGDIDIIADENYFDYKGGGISSREVAKENINQDFLNEGLHYGAGSFYSFYNGFSQSEIPIVKEQDIIKSKGDMDYYFKVKTKIDKLFTDNPVDEFLTGIIPESKFVRIYYDKDKYYCFGVVSESGIPQYICYAMPSFYSDNPPQEFRGLSRWIPADANDAKGKGYWMIFQSAESGKYIQT